MILLIAHYLTDGGAEAVAARLSKILPGEKTVVIFENKVSYDYEGRLISIDEPIPKNPFIRFYRLLKRFVKIRRIKNDITPSISISFMEYPNFLNILSKNEDLVIATVHVAQFVKYKDFYDILGRFFVRILYNKADLVVAVSRGISKELEMLGVDPKKLMVIYNPVDIHRIVRLSQEEISEDFISSSSVITIGRLTLQKGQWHLIRLFKEVKSNLKSAKLIILGDGELKEYLVILSRELGFKTFVWDEQTTLNSEYDVYFLGFQKNPYKFLAKAGVLAFTSLYEGLPNVLVEGMVCGIPVLSSDCKYGPREILAPETDLMQETKTVEFAKYGVLLPVCDGKMYSASDGLTREETLWAKIIVDMLSNEEKRLHYQKVGRIRANDFSTEKIKQEWLKILRF